jgi:hypothetical protein
MVVSAFCFSAARFRRLVILLAVMLSVSYIYVSIFGRMEIDEQTIVRIKDGMREGFIRGASSVGLAPVGGRYGTADHDDNPAIRKKPPVREPVTKKEPEQPKELGIPDEDFAGDKFEPGMELSKNMMRHAWDGYRKYAWGEDEVAPVRRGPVGFLGPHSMLVSIIDSLDTLMIMRMDAEYVEARDYLFSQLNFDKPMNVSLFECNIRILGGLLSAFALTGDGRYVTKAFDLGQRFMFNFNDLEVFPDNRLDLMAHTNLYGSVDLSPEKVLFLAQVGTFSLEFAYLSDVLNDPIYKKRALDIVEKISQMKTTLEGLYPASLRPNVVEQRDDCNCAFEY